MVGSHTRKSGQEEWKKGFFRAILWDEDGDDEALRQE